MSHRRIACSILITLTLLIGEVAWIDGKILSRCDAVKELQRGGISRTFISNWICLMESESGLNTKLITGPKTASSYNYGIFQIGSLKWCARGRTGGLCNKRCEDFTNDDIQDDIVCAKMIQDREGFKAWPGWLKKCKPNPNQLPNISMCRRRRR